MSCSSSTIGADEAVSLASMPDLPIAISALRHCSRVLVIGGAASGGIYTVALGELGERFSGHELTTGTASFSATWGLGALVGALGSGIIFQAFGPDGLPYTIAIIFAAFALSRLALIRD